MDALLVMVLTNPCLLILIVFGAVIGWSGLAYVAGDRKSYRSGNME